MKDLFKKIFLKILHNAILRNIGTKLFYYFPTAKKKIINFRNKIYIKTSQEKKFAKNDFLVSIKKEIENKRSKGRG